MPETVCTLTEYQKEELIKHNAEILWFHIDEPLTTDSQNLLHVIPTNDYLSRLINWLQDPQGKKVNETIVKTFQLMQERIKKGLNSYIEESRDAEDLTLLNNKATLKESYEVKNAKGDNRVMNIWKIAYPEIALKVTCHHRFCKNHSIEKEALLINYSPRKMPDITKNGLTKIDS